MASEICSTDGCPFEADKKYSAVNFLRHLYKDADISTWKDVNARMQGFIDDTEMTDEVKNHVKDTHGDATFWVALNASAVDSVTEFVRNPQSDTVRRFITIMGENVAVGAVPPSAEDEALLERIANVMNAVVEHASKQSESDYLEAIEGKLVEGLQEVADSGSSLEDDLERRLNSQ